MYDLSVKVRPWELGSSEHPYLSGLMISIGNLRLLKHGSVAGGSVSLALRLEGFGGNEDYFP
jgi:hypothetical protein